MIVYDGGLYGVRVLFRMHGSALFKALMPSLLSSIAYVILFQVTDLHEDDSRLFDHPYPMAALMVAFSFLLTFKMSFAYNRYWEAMTAVHQMHSKWLDAGMELASFHYQSKGYTQPPSFGKHPEITQLIRERERLNEPTMEEMQEQIAEMAAEPSLRSRFAKMKQKHGSRRLSQDAIFASSLDIIREEEGQDAGAVTVANEKEGESTEIKLSTSFSDKRATIARLSPRTLPKGKQPSLFLQESAHLLSLLSAVAMSTLRNDLEDAESPLSTFEPGTPWPCVDPDAYSADVRKGWSRSKHRSLTIIKYLLGKSRTDASRTLYNWARPFRVIGGVSDAEVRMLQAAKGPLAKVALCSMWWQEFISREYLAGSTGNVAPPIISRLFQFTSDGMLGYNQARKIAYIPFPFPHAQITSLYILVVCVLIPILMLSYVTNEIYGMILNFLTVMCFAGFHEVARELENPFINVPNDIPLNNFHTQFCEALMTTYSGYHPDSFWEIEGEKVVAKKESAEVAAAAGAVK